MGMYDTFGKQQIQLKNGLCELIHYNVGDEVPIEDGIFAGYEGFAVISDGILVGTLDKMELTDKWGAAIEIDINARNPITAVVDAIEQSFSKPEPTTEQKIHTATIKLVTSLQETIERSNPRADRPHWHQEFMDLNALL